MFRRWQFFVLSDSKYTWYFLFFEKCVQGNKNSLKNDYLDTLRLRFDKVLRIGEQGIA